MNIFRDFVEINFDYDIVDVLDTYESLFERLYIDLGSYEDEIRNPWDGNDLQETFKLILLNEAQNNGIIPETWDIYQNFDVEESFAIVNYDDFDEEEINKVIEDFEDWCGLKLHCE